MVKLSRGPATSGPSSSLGIMRFFDVDTGGPKMSPEFVVIVAVVLIILVLLVKNLNLI
ncbi:preprotein translocase subunit Sec61beta [Candidatus Micrarchaeota archaeon]|nr:preprotein translocase subunit Sec61beta [Candidatus Micrarchaeota archaeon]MBU2476560.1 preprotein translocase subunit Sec61beta [Candidatus Micrarchaeota archaeon]